MLIVGGLASVGILEIGIDAWHEASHIVLIVPTHGDAAAVSADQNWARMFQQKEAAEDLEEVAIVFANVAGPEANQIRLPKLLVTMGLAASGAEANRKIAEKAVKVDGDAVESLLIRVGPLPARLTVRLGKRAKIAKIS